MSGKDSSRAEGERGEAMNDREGEYGLVMPFVVCQSNGGTYDDHGFVAGCEYGYIHGLLAAKPPVLERYVRTETMPQYDLLAMHEGYSMKAEAWEEYSDEWTHVVFTRDGE